MPWGSFFFLIMVLVLSLRFCVLFEVAHLWLVKPFVKAWRFIIGWAWASIVVFYCFFLPLCDVVFLHQWVLLLLFTIMCHCYSSTSPNISTSILLLVLMLFAIKGYFYFCLLSCKLFPSPHLLFCVGFLARMHGACLTLT